MDAYSSDATLVVVHGEHQLAHIVDEVADDAGLRLGLRCKVQGMVSTCPEKD